MATDDEAATQARVPRERLETAMAEVAEVRREFVYATQAGAGADRRLLAKFHAAVMSYYLELRTYRDEEAIADEWGEVELWEGAEGIDTLNRYRNQTVEVESSNPGRRRGATTETRPYHLPGDKLLRAADALDQLAKNLGLSIPIDRSGMGLYSTDKAPKDEQSEPVNDDIPKPR